MYRNHARPLLTIISTIGVLLTLVNGLVVNSISDKVQPPLVREPRGRGTIRLVLSCVITLTLCVWTAIHLNIISNPSMRRYLGYKSLFVLLGLFAPEFVLATAVGEWKSAKEVLMASRLADAGNIAKNAALIAGAMIKYANDVLPEEVIRPNKILTAARNAVLAAARDAEECAIIAREAANSISITHKD